MVSVFVNNINACGLVIAKCNVQTGCSSCNLCVCLQIGTVGGYGTAVGEVETVRCTTVASGQHEIGVCVVGIGGYGGTRTSLQGVGAHSFRRLWVGADPGGICIIDINEYYGNGTDKLPRRWLNPRNSQLAANSINRIGGDMQGHVFVSMVNVGCDILTPSLLPITMLTTPSFTVPAADGSGLIWAGGTGSVFLQSDGREWKMEQGQFDVIAMMADSKGRLWMVSNYQGVDSCGSVRRVRASMSSTVTAGLWPICMKGRGCRPTSPCRWSATARGGCG